MGDARVRFAARAVTVFVCLVLVGCDTGDRAARSEAAAVSRAIDVLRAAENPGKSPLLAALRAVPCSVADVCAVQSSCVAAYEKHVAALGLLDEAKASMNVAPAASVAVTVTAAERSLTEAKTLTDTCVTRQGELVRRYHVGR